jgi:hypothetical protein
MKMFRNVVFVLATLLGLTACAAWRDTYTLSPAVKESARRYGDVMDDFADQALLANVLRARDQAPMNFNDLSSITGSLSLSGTLGLMLPFGPYNGDRSAAMLGAAKNAASPSITTSTSPIINIGTLNTQGFMLTMIQPISSTYVLSKWNEGLGHRLLLYLFVKSIRFCDDRNTNDVFDPKTRCAEREVLKNPSNEPCARFAAQDLRRVHTNDPDNPSAMTDFRTLVNCLFDSDDRGDAGGGDVDLKSIMILDPLGIAIPFGEQLQAQYPAPRITSDPQASANPLFPLPAPSKLDHSVQMTVGSEMTIFGTISGLSDGQLHVGNASCPFAGKYEDLCLKPQGTTSYLQFYKEYPAQVVMCVNTWDKDPLKDQLGGHRITPVSETTIEEAAKERIYASPEVRELRFQLDVAKPEKKESLQKQFDDKVKSLLPGEVAQIRVEANAHNVLAALTLPKGGGTPPTSGSPSGTGGTGGAPGAPSSSGSSGTAGGMSQVTMALIPSRISAIIPSRYCQKDQLVLSASSEEEFDQTTTGFAHVEWRSIAEVIQYLGALARHGTDQGAFWTTSASGAEVTHRILEVRKDSNGRISVDYGGAHYSVGYREGVNASDATQGDHSLQSLALVNELISIAKISGTLPVSQPVQVLP